MISFLAGISRPSPYALVHTLNAGLLPPTPTQMTADLRKMAEKDFEALPQGSGREAHQWLRQVAYVHMCMHVQGGAPVAEAARLDMT